ncbi:MAG: fibro-slime domain-containing protein [Chitinivibrionales bacterium]|nr:fibro-slime domain-containing protein [Chitinivibrionales bacterium]
MKQLWKQTQSQGGYILLATVVLVLAVSTMGVVMVQNTKKYEISTKNLKNKAKAFYASDGIMTLLVQQLIDDPTNKDLYGSGPGNRDIGDIDDPRPWGDYRQNDDKHVITGGGSGLAGAVEDHLHFAYSDDIHDATISVKVEEMDNPNDEAVAGIMIRQANAPSSPFFAVCATPGGNVVVHTRQTSGQASVLTAAEAAALPVTLTLQRTGNQFSALANGASLGGAIDINMGTDPVYAGLFVSSNINGAGCQATFSALSGIELSDEGIEWPEKIEGFTVNYKFENAGGNAYYVKTDAYQLDGDDKKIYSAPLKQYFSTEVKQEALPDTVWASCIFYDYRCDGTNPNFQNCGTTKKFLDGRGIEFVKHTLGPDRKIMRKPPYLDVSCAANAGNFPLVTSHLIEEWFLPSGTGGPDPDVEFIYDTAQQRYRWALKADGSELPYYDPAHPERGHKGPNYDPNYNMANVVLYEELPFERVLHDTLWDGTPVPSGSYVCNPPEPDPLNPGSFLQPGFYPLDNKGLYPAPGNETVLGNEICISKNCPRCGMVATSCGSPCPLGYKAVIDHNYSFAMEFHSRFTYVAGQILKFHGGDDFWVYIDDKLVIDKGGTYSDVKASIDLDTMGLASGQKYNVDIFWAERSCCRGTLTITTNMEIFTSAIATAGKRVWKRDYGMLD